MSNLQLHNDWYRTELLEIALPEMRETRGVSSLPLNTFTCLSSWKLPHVFLADRSSGMLQFAENEEISTANLRVSRRRATNGTRYGARRATLRRADWRHARLDRLACSPTDRPAGCIVCIAALPGSLGA